MKWHRKFNCSICLAFFYSIVSVMWICLLLNSSFAAAKDTAAKGSVPQPRAELAVHEWFAFGSGCKSSSKAGSRNLKVQRSAKESLQVRLALEEFILNVPSGGSGVRECAVRLSIEALPGFRIKDIGVKSQIQAKKVDSVQLRSRVLLLVGDRLLSRQEWNLAPQEFARFRNQELYLVPGLQAEMSLPQLPCGKAQILGLDFTFEGLTHAIPSGVQIPKEDSFLRMAPGSETELEIFFEKCR
jgi:hypothetical protein